MSSLNNILTTRDIHIAVKKNDGITYLMERFGFETPEVLFQTIHKVSPALADDFVKQLKKKQKKAHRDRTEATCEVVEEVSVVAVVPSEEKMEVTLGEDVKTMQKRPMADLNALMAEEQELSTMQCALECAHKENVAKRRAIIEQLVEAKKALQEVQKIVAEKKQLVIALYQEYRSYEESMHALNVEMGACREYLVEIRDKIAALQKVTIYVYETGVIEGENIDVNVAVSVDKLKAKIDQLIAMPESDAVTMGQIKSLARLSLMLEGYTDKTVELVFESSKVQALYESVA